jgi:uncharacterized membrane protein
MRRDTRIVLSFVSAIPVLILSLSVFCSWAVANGASPRWRLLFRPLCHGFPERCLTLFDVPMPICARCTGIYAGMLAGVAAALLFFAMRWVRFLRERIMKRVALVSIVPLALDGLSQLAGLRESTNPLRIATGLIAGLAFGLWILSAIEFRDEPAFTTS